MKAILKTVAALAIMVLLCAEGDTFEASLAIKGAAALILLFLGAFTGKVAGRAEK